MKENIKRDSAIDLFNSILKTARDAGALQELDRIIDYDSACEFEEKNKRPISNYEFNCIFSVDYGGSEGIYIDAWLDGYLDESGHTQRLHFGTIKTLERDLAAMKTMGEACGILQYYASDYLNKNLSRYEPDPTKLSLFHNSDTPFWCRSCKSMGNIAVLKRPCPWNEQMEQYAFRCETCGAETCYFSSSAELRKAWNNGEYWIRKSDAILVKRDALQSVCKLRGHSFHRGKIAFQCLDRTEMKPLCMPGLIQITVEPGVNVNTFRTTEINSKFGGELIIGD